VKSWKELRRISTCYASVCGEKEKAMRTFLVIIKCLSSLGPSIEDGNSLTYNISTRSTS